MGMKPRKSQGLTKCTLFFDDGLALTEVNNQLIQHPAYPCRDVLMWVYGSGFPKCSNISKQIDKSLGHKPTIVGNNPNHRPVSGTEYKGVYAGGNTGNAHITKPTSPEAQQWDGWSTALKPAYEPIILARKPFKGAAYKNVLKHGTGALNIDDTRIDTKDKLTRKLGKTTTSDSGWQSAKRSPIAGKDGGRWPANLLLDEESSGVLDEQTGVLKSGKTAPHHRRTVPRMSGDVYGKDKGTPDLPPTYGDSGGASRFFYVAKASKKEKNEGVSGKNTHPTVKPVALMRWLTRLVTPPGGVILDPYCGSGTTGVAAALEGFEFIGVERDPEYAQISKDRIRAVDKTTED